MGQTHYNGDRDTLLHTSVEPYLVIHPAWTKLNGKILRRGLVGGGERIAWSDFSLSP